MSFRPSANVRPESNCTRKVRLLRDTTGRSRARPGTSTVPGSPWASAKRTSGVQSAFAIARDWRVFANAGSSAGSGCAVTARTTPDGAAEALTELGRLAAQLRVGQRLNRGLERVDLGHDRAQAFQFTIVLGTDDFGE